MAYSPGLHERLESLYGLLQRHGFAPVEEIEVQVIGSEPAETALAGDHSSFASCVVRQDLAHKEDVFATASDCFADQFFRGAIRVHFRRINERQAEVETRAQGGDFLIMKTRIFRHVPSALAKNGNGSTRWKCCCANGRQGLCVAAMRAPSRGM